MILIFSILNLYFILILFFSEIFKKKFDIKKYNTFEIYLYTKLYLILLSIIFAYFDILNILHPVILIFLILFFLINYKFLYKIHFIKIFKKIIILNIILITCINREFIWWDEISSWGMRTKEILFFNSIYYDNSLVHLGKPSGSSLLHYLYIKYTGFNEGVIIFSQTQLTIFLIYSIGNDFKILKKNISNYIIIYLIIYFLSFIVNYGIFSIYTGLITSLIFIKIISSFFINNQDIHFKYKFFEIFPLIVLILFFKDFSLFYILYIAIILFFHFFDKKKIKTNFQNLIIFTSSLIFTIFIQKLILLKQKFDTTLSNQNFHDLIEFFRNIEININQLANINIYQGAFLRIPNQFIENFFSIENFFTEFKINIFFWFVLFTLLNLIYFFYNPSIYRKKFIILITLYFINFLHLFLILFSYNIFFGANEAEAMASFGRYMGLYFMPYLIILIYLGISEFLVFKKFSYFFIFCLVLISPAKSIEILIPNKIFKFNSDLNYILTSKQKIKNISNYIKNNPKIKNAYVLVDGDDGYIHNIYKFYMYPININKECWDFDGDIENSKYIFSCNKIKYLNMEKFFMNFDIIINHNNSKKFDILLNNNFYGENKNIFDSKIFYKKNNL